MRRGPSVQTVSVVLFGSLLVALASLLVLTSAAYHANAAQIVTVNMSDTAFLPRTITISQGDLVIWNNNGTVIHTSTSYNGQADSWDSGDMNPQQIFSHTFTKVGNFSYYCSYHPEMIGNVVVQAPVPEFPGFLAFATVGFAVLLGLAAERVLRRSN